MDRVREGNATQCSVSLSSGTGIKEMYLFPALFILAAIPFVCKGSCDVVPKDQYIEAGSDTEIFCKTSCVQGKVYWTLNNRRISESLSNTVNSSHTVLSLRNFTHHRATLQCHRADNEQVLGGTTIRTYTRPSKILCILHYNNQPMRGVPKQLTCNWEHQIDSSLKINYTVLSVSPSNSIPSEICRSHKTTCTAEYADINEKISLSLAYFNVTVRAKSAAWEASSDSYTFERYRILKITYPKLNVTAISDGVLIGWNITPSIGDYNCQVKYRKVGSEEAPTVVNTTLKQGRRGQMTIEKVESCSNYTFAMRCALQKAKWSDWSPETTVLTKLKKNDVKLHMWRKIVEAEKNGVREVHALWMVIPSTCQDMITYTVKQTPDKEHMSGVNDTGTLCANSVCYVNQEAHRIHLTLFRDESLFAEDSVYVPAIGESLPQVTDIQSSTLEGVILVSWKAPVRRVSGYMIDYTHNGIQYYWKETKQTNTTLIDLLDKKPYNITVTPLFGDKTGHGTQALQICSRLGDPGNVTDITIEATDTSANVNWNVDTQEACSGVVVSYTVVVHNTQKGPQLNVTVESTKQHVLLENLNPETQYIVYVVATALTGTPTSGEGRFSTKRFDPRLSTTLAVSGGILIVLVLSLGLCCAIRWKKFKEKPVPNPRHSSVALWPSTSHDKEICSFQPFHNPSESACDMVCIEEAQRTTTHPSATGSNDIPACDPMEEYTDPAMLPAPVAQNEDPVEPVETQDPSSPGESTELLSSKSSPSSPYRSQSSVETPALRTNKQYKSVPVKQQEKTPPLMVYVSLDMFEQGQGR